MTSCRNDILSRWWMDVYRGYFYCYGTLNGREWETSYITSMYGMEDHYVVHTANSVYYLYYDDSLF